MDAMERIDTIKQYLAVGETGKALEALAALSTFLKDRDQRAQEHAVQNGRDAMRRDYYLETLGLGEKDEDEDEDEDDVN